MTNAIALSRVKDAAFTRAVEEESGQNVASCYQCGACTAGCPAGFAYDRQVNQIMRGLQLGLKDQVLSSKSIWLCLSCSMCSLRCPNKIDVARVMETLRHMALREGRVSVPEMEKFWFSFLDTVRAFGRSYEIGTMALYMLRSLHVFTDLDLAPEALKKHKLPIRPHVVGGGGAQAVGRIMKRFQERARKEGSKA